MEILMYICSAAYVVLPSGTSAVIRKPQAQRSLVAMPLRSWSSSLVLVVVLGLLHPFASAQSIVAAKNPIAKKYVIEALAAMGAPNGIVPHGTAKATATVIDERVPHNPRKEVLWAKGTTRFRIDWENSTGKQSYAINQGVRVAKHSVGPDHPPSLKRVLWARPNFFPMFSLLAEWNSPYSTIILLPDQTINKRTAHVVCMSVSQIGDPGYRILDPHITETMFYIDAETHLLLRLSNGHPPGPVHIRQLDEYVAYSNYQKVGDMFLPLRQSTYLGGRLMFILTINSIQFDGQLDNSLFTLETPNEN